MKTTAFDRLLKSSIFRDATPEEQLEFMLGYKSFNELLTLGFVFDIEGARAKLGYSGWGLRRLCRQKKISHIERVSQYYFLPSQIRGAFNFVRATA